MHVGLSAAGLVDPIEFCRGEDADWHVLGDMGFAISSRERAGVFGCFVGLERLFLTLHRTITSSISVCGHPTGGQSILNSGPKDERDTQHWLIASFGQANAGGMGRCVVSCGRGSRRSAQSTKKRLEWNFEVYLITFGLGGEGVALEKRIDVHDAMFSSEAATPTPLRCRHGRDHTSILASLCLALPKSECHRRPVSPMPCVR